MDNAMADPSNVIEPAMRGKLGEQCSKRCCMVGAVEFDAAALAADVEADRRRGTAQPLGEAKKIWLAAMSGEEREL